MVREDSRGPVSTTAAESTGREVSSALVSLPVKGAGALRRPGFAPGVASRPAVAGTSSGPEDGSARDADASRRPASAPEVVSASATAGASSGEVGSVRVAGSGIFRISAVVDRAGAGVSGMGVSSSRAASAIDSSVASVVATGAGMVVSVIPRQSPPSSRRASIRRCWGKPAAGRSTNSSRTPPGAGYLVRPRMLHSRSASRMAKRASVPGWSSERTRTRQAWVGGRFSLE